MSTETRSNSALFKRAEQLKRWEESDTNREPVLPKHKSRKIKFSSGCVFLAACAAGDKDEVLKLLEKGADINTANVDGLTALHQACIDDNIDMVEFLVDHGADVNRGDNEGWTPLHATASCGFLYIAKYLIEKGANVAAVNNDGELAVDIAECQKMEDLLHEEIKKRGIDCEAARNEEKRVMLQDALEWLATKSSLVDTPHPKNGATALHVAAAKGYTDVIKILLQCGADIDTQDIDGWSPLHAAAHWGQKEACQILTENLADMDAKNFVGQTPFDLAEPDMYRYLDELKKEQNKDDVNKRVAKKRIEIQDRTETPNKLVKVELEIKKEDDNTNENEIDKTKSNSIEMDVSSESETETSSETESNSTDDEKKNLANSLTINDTVNNISINKTVENVRLPSNLSPKHIIDTINDENNLTTWRKQQQQQNIRQQIKNDLQSPIKTTGDKINTTNENEVTLRRTSSFKDSDKEFNYSDIKDDLIENNSAISTSLLSTSPTSLTSSFPLKTTLSRLSTGQNHNQPLRSGLILPISTNQSLNNITSSTTPSTPTTPGGTRLQMFKNFFKSFVPPVRDEESETQRKAHAKRVRETRRSTQGVTLEEIKSAEQFVKKKSQPNNNNNNTNNNNNNNNNDNNNNNNSNSNNNNNTTVSINNNSSNNNYNSSINNNNEHSGPNNGDTSNGVSVTATITTATPTVITRDTASSPATEEINVTHERRPSWRLRIDSSNKFKLEDATKPADPPNTPSFVRRTGIQNIAPRPSSAPIETADTTVTLPFRRPKSQDDKEQDKENDVRNAQATLATQAAIQRRRRPKRRSTGVVSFDNVDDLDQEKDPIAAVVDSYDDTTKLNHQDSGNERSSRSRLGSTTDTRNENGEIDYKKLYEQAIAENERLKDKLRKTDEELRDTKQTLEKINVVTSKNSLSELEKRERRAMERKLSEMEEELKQLQKLKAENERLKADNRSLTRVITKLTNSPKK